MKDFSMLPLHEKPARYSYHDSESRPSLREQTENLHYERPGLWQQVVEYAEHVSGPKTRGAIICKVVITASFILSVFSLVFTAVRG